MKCDRRQIVALVLGLSITLCGVSGCVSVTHVNQPLAQHDPDAGYRPRHAKQRRPRVGPFSFWRFRVAGPARQPSRTACWKSFAAQR